MAMRKVYSMEPETMLESKMAHLMEILKVEKKALQLVMF